MSRMINASVFVLIAFFAAATQAKTISLAPNESKSLANTSLFNVHATCTIQCTPKALGKIKIRVLKNNGTVNGKNLSTGQATSLRVTNNSSISVSAESGTQVNLINLGDERVQAVCSI